MSERLPAISDVAPTRVNAMVLQRIALAELAHLGFSEPEAIANPEDDLKIERGLRLLKDPTLRYRGIGNESDMVGFSKIGAWNLYDQLPYSPLLRATVLRRRLPQFIRQQIQGTHETIDASYHDNAILGLHQLSVREGVAEPLRHDAVDALLDDAVSYADTEGKELRTQLAVGRDHFIGHYKNVGFESTGKMGRPIGDVTQQLYSRKPYKAS